MHVQTWGCTPHILLIVLATNFTHCTNTFLTIIMLLINKYFVLEGDAVIPKKGKSPGMKIFHRHHFSSTLKRMSVVAGYTLPGTTDTIYVATIKGAPETLKSMVCECAIVFTVHFKCLELTIQINLCL